MNALGQTLWMQWVVLGLLLAVFFSLVYVAWWALFADRPRGRRRCPRCWYDMSFSPGMTCPECGRTARRERELGRRRRRLGTASLAILGCVAIGCYVDFQVGLRDWTSYMPDAVLIWSMPYAGGDARGVLSELESREINGGLSEEQWFAVLKTAVRGDRGARPPSEAWARKYGNFHVTWASRRFSSLDDQMKSRVEQLLLSMPLPIEVTTRSIWPAGSRPSVAVEVQDRWRATAQARCTARVRLPDVAPATFFRMRRPIQQTSFLLELPELPPGDHEVTIDFDLALRSSADDPWSTTQTQSRTCTIRVANAPDEMLQPITDPETDELIRATFSQRPPNRPQLTKWTGGGELPVRIGLDAQQTVTSAFNDAAIGLRVELLRNGELGRALDIWWHAGVDPPPGQYAWHVPMWNDEVLSAPARETDEWMLRVRGLRELALRVDGAKRYWAGAVTVPVDVALRNGEAPSRGWLRDRHLDRSHVPLEEGTGAFIVDSE
jgi:hypothetical protein